MWSSIMGPYPGHNFMPQKQQKREFGITFQPVIASGKSFTNPNFVNKFDKYNNFVKPVDSSAKIENSCRSHIIDSIKEQCPAIIPTFEEPTTAPAEPNPTVPAMCFSNPTPKSEENKPQVTNMRQLGEDSIEIENRQETLGGKTTESTVNKSKNSCSPRINIILLEHKPSSNMRSPPKTPGGSCGRLRQLSTTDTEDSFIMFDHEGNEEHLKDEDQNEDFISKESLCPRLRKPSVCESEDSFILFECDDTASHDNNESDYYFDSSDEETDQQSDCHDDWCDDNNFDETDSPFSIVQPKKVRFASDNKLCQVHPMVKWSYAYQAARKGPWEMYARDRCRFKERAYKIERDIKHVFNPQHRERIFKERFENL